MKVSRRLANRRAGRNNSRMVCDELTLPPLLRPGWLRAWQLRAVLARAEARRLLEHAIADAAARHAGVAADKVAVGRDGAGRPVLAGLPPGYACSLAYTHGCAVAAVACGVSVGIDCERTDAALDWRAVAAEFFSAEENAALTASTGPGANGGREAAAREIFFRLWTRKEAWAKAGGLGTRALDARWPLSAEARDPEQMTAWAKCEAGGWLVDFSLGDACVGSVALG